METKIIEYISEFFVMERGALIKNPMEEIWLGDGMKMRRMGLKHIVESRLEVIYQQENSGVKCIYNAYYRPPPKKEISEDEIK